MKRFITSEEVRTNASILAFLMFALTFILDIVFQLAGLYEKMFITLSYGAALIGFLLIIAFIKLLSPVFRKLIDKIEASIPELEAVESNNYLADEENFFLEDDPHSKILESGVEYEVIVDKEDIRYYKVNWPADVIIRNGLALVPVCYIHTTPYEDALLRGIDE